MALPPPAPARREKATHSINCHDFDSAKHDFERWVLKFEKAVMLAANLREEDADTLEVLYKQWLPLKLDETASSHLDNVAAGASWEDTKTQLEDLLIDPHEKMRWRSRQWTIKWDGKESIHMLATRVTRHVDKYDKHLPADVREQEYFNRFRSAFKKPFMRVIDMNCPEGHQTIDEAKGAVMRYQLANADDDSADAGDPYRSVKFAGASLQPDRATGIESAIAALGTKIEDLAISLRSMDDRLRYVEDSMRGGRRMEDRRSGIPAWSGDQRRDNGYRDRGRSPRAYSPARRDNYNDRSSYRPSRSDYRDNGSDSRRWDDQRDRNYRGRQESRGSGSRDRPRDYSRDSRYNGDSRRGPGSNQNGRQGGRQGGRNDNQGGNYRSSRHEDRDDGDAYRAIETGDEYSSQGSEAEEAVQPSSRQQQASNSQKDDEQPRRGNRREN